MMKRLLVLLFALASPANAAPATPAAREALGKDTCQGAEESCSLGLLQRSGRHASPPPAASAEQLAAAETAARLLAVGVAVLRDMKASLSLAGELAAGAAAAAAAAAASGPGERLPAALIATAREARAHGFCEGSDFAAMSVHMMEVSRNTSFSQAESHSEGGLAVLDVLNPSKTPPECLVALSVFGSINRGALAVCAEKMWGLDAKTSSCIASFAEASAPTCLPACAAASFAESPSKEMGRRCSQCADSQKPKLVACVAEAAGVSRGCARCMQGLVRGVDKFCLRTQPDQSVDGGCMVNEFLTFAMCTGDLAPRFEVPAEVPGANYWPMASYDKPFEQQ